METWVNIKGMTASLIVNLLEEKKDEAILWIEARPDGNVYVVADLNHYVGVAEIIKQNVKEGKEPTTGLVKRMGGC